MEQEKSQSQKIQELILSNYAQGQKVESWRTIANKEGFDYQYFLSIVSRMKRRGQIPEEPIQAQRRKSQSKSAHRKDFSKYPPPTAPTALPPAPEQSIGELDGLINLKGAMPREERLRQLSYIARNGSELGRIKAMDALEQAEKAAGSSYGPPPPTTKDEVVPLIVQLLKSTKPEWVQEAIEIYAGADTEAETPTQSPETDGP